MKSRFSSGSFSLIINNLFSLSGFNLFLSLDFKIFCCENPLSQGALDTGITKAMEANKAKSG